MKAIPLRWSPSEGDWLLAAPEAATLEVAALEPQLVLVFAGAASADSARALTALRRCFPATELLGCSTAGEIMGAEVFDESIVAMAYRFDSTLLASASVELGAFETSGAAGRALAAELPAEGLRHVLVMSDGLMVNGSDLASGMAEALAPGVSITGGLAGDGARFERTQVFFNDRCCGGIAAAIGFYGDRLRVGFGSLGGWDVFGPDRIVTRSVGNVLYELDGQSALDLYKTYLGDYAKELPSSGLLFPLSLQLQGSDERVVRTILGVDEAAHSLTFAGDVPEGSRAQLMRANFDRLIDGAVGAASICMAQSVHSRPWQAALLISCVGRKMVLQQRVEEEVEGVRDVLGADTRQIGFYSYGELSPLASGSPCKLHNQTMTITTFAEVA